MEIEIEPMNVLKIQFLFLGEILKSFISIKKGKKIPAMTEESRYKNGYPVFEFPVIRQSRATFSTFCCIVKMIVNEIQKESN